MESICALAQGSEPAASVALGGEFVIENCGFFGKCDHRVERYNFANGKQDYVELYYCSTDLVKTGFAVVILLLLFYFVFKKMRASKLPSMNQEQFTQ